MRLPSGSWASTPFKSATFPVTLRGVAGFTWFFLGLVTTLIGTIRSVRFGQQNSLRSSLYVVLVLVIVGVALLRLTVRWTDALSRAKYIPIICQQQREVYRLSLHALAHDGEYPHDGPNTGLRTQ